jgi:signal transduction histidine kinase
MRAWTTLDGRRRVFVAAVAAVALVSLNEEFKTALVGIRRFSKLIQDAEQHELDQVRHFAADIDRAADRLDRTVDELLGTDAVGEPKVEVSPEVSAADGAVVEAPGAA